MDILALIIAAAFILHGKSLIYIFILLLFFFVPKTVFHGRQWGWTIASIVIIFVLVLLETKYMSQFAVVEDRTPGVSVKRQMLYIILHPLNYLKMLYNEKIIHQLITNISDFSIDSFSSTIKSAIPIILFGVAVTEPKANEKDLDGRHKYFNLCCMFVFSMTYILVNTALFLIFNRVGSNVINGVQMRYFLPVLFLFFFPFSTLKIQSDIHHYSMKISLFSILFLINAYVPLILRL
jgi:hypothetical protein